MILDVLSSTKAAKEIESINIGKEEINYLFSDDMIISIRYPTEIMKKAIATNKSLARLCNTRSIHQNQWETGNQNF